jgi:hypothetical protein
LAKCKLNTSDPKFVILGDASDADLQSGLEELQRKLATEHTLSHFVNHPMPGFPDFQNKVWKWDFAPGGDTSSTRKGWRLLAFVPEPNGPEPILARAFLCHDKDEGPKKNHAKFIAKALKKYLAEIDKRIEATPERFRRQDLPDGTIISLCYECGEALFSPDHAEADLLESTHECESKL